MARVALVTGANSGIGYAIAERLLRDGFALGYATQDTGPEYEEPKQRLEKPGPVHRGSRDPRDPKGPERLLPGSPPTPRRLQRPVHKPGPTQAQPGPPPHAGRR